MYTGSNNVKQLKNKIMVSSIQKEKAEMFLKFHQDKEILVLLNSWDIGSSKLIEACGYKAIATTSMGIAASLGYPDCQVIQLAEMIEAITGIVQWSTSSRNCGYRSRIWKKFK